MKKIEAPIVPKFPDDRIEDNNTLHILSAFLVLSLILLMVYIAFK